MNDRPILICGEATPERVADPDMVRGHCERCVLPIVWHRETNAHDDERICMDCGLSGIAGLGEAIKAHFKVTRQ